ncbi:MAG: helix-hairpin-helix domain-containing protein [Peptococcaceae bacterium]|nr:helix-hairpin-helix domain-containing protein [Peptococcaceae bacterium]
MIQVDRKQQAVIIVLAAVILFTAGYWVSRWRGDPQREKEKAENIIQAGQGDGGREVVVHVSGAVEKPGVYKFTGEARVLDALEKAVPLDRADVQGLNLAAPLKDGQKIVVPVKQEMAQAGSTPAQAGYAPSQGSTAPSRGDPASVPKEESHKVPARVNINRAGAKELEALPGLGPALSQRVVNYRESRGLFVSEEDIKNVPGIGEKLYDQIKDYITVN